MLEISLSENHLTHAPSFSASVFDGSDALLEGSGRSDGDGDGDGDGKVRDVNREPAAGGNGGKNSSPLRQPPPPLIGSASPSAHYRPRDLPERSSHEEGRSVSVVFTCVLGR
jgi:hypothetical protein